jgi:hypothetical protein
MNALHDSSGLCPSRLRFDRLLAGELESSDAEQLEQHAASCARCGAVFAEIKRGYEAFAPGLPEAVAQHVQQRARSARSRTWTRALVPALAAASVLLAFLAWPARDDSRLETVRLKGTQLKFYVLHEGVVRQGADGERVQPGDHVEFAYASERDAYLAIVSIDAARKASVYYARAGRAAPMPAARRAVLEESTLLDDTLGPETVYALVCAEPIEVAPLLRALEQEPERAPTAVGCSVERYTLHKVPR